MTDSPAKPTFGQDDLTRRAGWDALAEDIFGLSLRGFRTMAAAIRSPALLARAAHDPGWLDRYTPSIRVAFTLVALTIGLRFLYSAEDSAFFLQMRNSLQPLEDQLAGRDLDAAARELLNVYFIAYPLAYFGLHALGGVILRVWGKGTPAPVRIRLYFICLIPSLIMGVGTIAVYGLLNGLNLLLLTQASLLISLLLYVLTAFRIQSEGIRRGPRLWRAALAGVTMLIIDTIISLMSFIVGLIFIFASLG